jgi:hypothetical protein
VPLPYDFDTDSNLIITPPSPAPDTTWLSLQVRTKQFRPSAEQGVNVYTQAPQDCQRQSLDTSILSRTTGTNGICTSAMM